MRKGVQFGRLVQPNPVQQARRFLSYSSIQKEYDVVVNGGGIVGAAFASNLLRLTGGKAKIAILERQAIKPLKANSDKPDVRVYALSPHSKQFLSTINAWQYVESRCKPYSSMQIWESLGPGGLRFNATDVGADALGFICEDSTVQSAIYKACEDQNYNIDIISDYALNEISNSNAESTLLELGLAHNQTKEKLKVQTRLMVGADGAASQVRKLVGIPSWGWGYGQEAVVATISLAATEANATAYQKYLVSGPLAVLPLWGNFASIVWSVPVAEANRLKQLSSAEFLQELNAALSLSDQPHMGAESLLPKFGNLSALPGFRKVHAEVENVMSTVLASMQLNQSLDPSPEVNEVLGPRVSFPLSFQQAKTYIGTRCALIGDAAHSIHPQAGQGLNLGVLDAKALSEEVFQAISQGTDFGSALVLERYSKDRYFKNLTMMGIVDSINTLFVEKNTEQSPLSKSKKLIRSIGLLGINSNPILKNAIAKFAMGLK